MSRSRVRPTFKVILIVLMTSVEKILDVASILAKFRDKLTHVDKSTGFQSSSVQIQSTPTQAKLRKPNQNKIAPTNSW